MLKKQCSSLSLKNTEQPSPHFTGGLEFQPCWVLRTMSSPSPEGLRGLQQSQVVGEGSGRHHQRSLGCWDCHESSPHGIIPALLLLCHNWSKNVIVRAENCTQPFLIRDLLFLQNTISQPPSVCRSLREYPLSSSASGNSLILREFYFSSCFYQRNLL